MKAGFASLVPILVLNLVASAGFVDGNPSVSDRVVAAVNSTATFLTTLGWVLIAGCALYCWAWASISQRIVHLLRYRKSFYTHLAAHAVVGAVILFLLSMAILYLAQRGELAGAPLWEAETFVPLALGSPAVGVVGAAVGMWTLRRHLRWYVSQEREPLKDVFTFVPGHRAKDDFERL
jgi:uncharacterized membrane protein YeaQ/YmgE (transglycosylase-associated protein family)